LNEFGEKNQIKVTDQELQSEIQKQLKMMPGQEKMVQEYYQKNPSVLANLRGSLYEEKIIKLIKSKAKANIKNISKQEAEKIIKDENEKNLKKSTPEFNKQNENKKETKSNKISSKTSKLSEKSKKSSTKKVKSKKVSKK